MQPPSACPCRGRIPWQGIVLAVSLLTFWNPQTTAQLTIEPVPFNAAEGTDVLLLVHNGPGNIIIYAWYQGEITDLSHRILSYSLLTQNTTQGPAFSYRETVYPNGSLLFVNVTKEDTGSYTLQTTSQDGSLEATTAEFRVHEKLLKPNITVNNSQPEEGDDSIALTCEPETEYTTYLWSINGQRISEGDRLQLSNNGRTLILFSVQRNDTGPYECETQNPVSGNRSDPLTLNISYGPDAPNITPSESYFRPGTDLRLFCHADSNPPAQYTWFFNESLLGSTQELLVPNLSTNNSGTYMCVAHNNVTGLSRNTAKNISLSEQPAQPHLTASNTTVAERGSVQLNCTSNDTDVFTHWIFNGSPLQLTNRMNLSLNGSVLTINPVLIEDAGEYQCQVSNPLFSSPSDPLRLKVIEGDPEPGPGDGGLSGGAIAGIVIGVIAGVALIAGLVYFLFFRKTGGSGPL